MVTGFLGKLIGIAILVLVVVAAAAGNGLGEGLGGGINGDPEPEAIEEILEEPEGEDGDADADADAVDEAEGGGQIGGQAGAGAGAGAGGGAEKLFLLYRVRKNNLEYKCYPCLVNGETKTFSSLDKLKSHYQLAHKGAKLSFECHTCGNRFPNRDAKDNHDHDL